MFPPKDSNGSSMLRLLSFKPKDVFFLLLLKYFNSLAPSGVHGYSHAILGNKLFYFQILCPYAFPFCSSVEKGFPLTRLGSWRSSAPHNGCFYTPSCRPFSGWNKAPEQHEATACPGPYRLRPPRARLLSWHMWHWVYVSLPANMCIIKSNCNFENIHRLWMPSIRRCF